MTDERLDPHVHDPAIGMPEDPGEGFRCAVAMVTEYAHMTAGFDQPLYGDDDVRAVAEAAAGRPTVLPELIAEVIGTAVETDDPGMIHSSMTSLAFIAATAISQWAAETGRCETCIIEWMATSTQKIEVDGTAYGEPEDGINMGDRVCYDPRYAGWHGSTYPRRVTGEIISLDEPWAVVETDDGDELVLHTGDLRRANDGAEGEA